MIFSHLHMLSISLIFAAFASIPCRAWIGSKTTLVSSSHSTRRNSEGFSKSDTRMNPNQSKNSRNDHIRRFMSMKDFPKPNFENTNNYIEAAALSQKFVRYNDQLSTNLNSRKRVIIIGGGLSGLAAAKYVADAGHEAVVLEARDILGGKVSAWQDNDGDWIETGLHIFFGAYPNMMNLFRELNIEDRLQWKKHQMIFAMQELPGEFTSFDFIPGIPAPFNFALAILTNQKMLSFTEKLQTAKPLLPMLLYGQDFIDQQDEFSVAEFMKKYDMPDRISDEIFVAMSKALDFIDPDKLSMAVVLTAMNRFLNEADGSQTAFLDGNQPDRLCEPLKQHIESKGGSVFVNSPVSEIIVDESNNNTITSIVLRSGEVLNADEYISAIPVDVFKRLIPRQWSTMPYFRQFDELEGIPVINVHLWFDRKLNTVDQLCFSRSPLLSVYADMSRTCKEYYDPNTSMLELVFAPCTPAAGSKVNWISKPDEEIVQVIMLELERLFPNEIAADGSKAKVRKYAVVRTPRSVYAAIPGRNKYRPSQVTPIPHFTLAGDWTSQKFLGSMEGAILAGKLAAQVVCESILSPTGTPESQSVKKISEDIIEKCQNISPRDPKGLSNAGVMSYGGGDVLSAFRPIGDNVDKPWRLPLASKSHLSAQYRDITLDKSQYRALIWDLEADGTALWQLPFYDMD